MRGLASWSRSFTESQSRAAEPRGLVPSRSFPSAPRRQRRAIVSAHAAPEVDASPVGSIFDASGSHPTRSHSSEATETTAILDAQMHHEVAQTTARQDTEVHHEDPWTFQQLISVLSGFVGSILSISAYSQQRVRGSSSTSISQANASRRSARIVQQLGGSLLDAEAESPLFSLGPVPPCTEASNLRRPGRHFTIITTAALPWRTGTAVNPLLRALNLAKNGRPTVLMLPFLGEEDQKKVLPSGTVFADSAAQEEVILAWCRERAKVDPAKIDLQFRWYPAKYVPFLGSIFPKGDCSKQLREDDRKDVLILEEPEHLCWYHHGERWPAIFKHVIGIVHTNYGDYIRARSGDNFKNAKWGGEVLPAIGEASVFAATTIVCSAYCDVNIKLSDTIMPLPNEVTCNVHGVREEFLEIGLRTHVPRSEQAPVYYLGKALFEKGWGELLELLKAAGSELDGLVIDGYGSGDHYDDIVQISNEIGRSAGASMNMHQGLDHADEAIHGYSVLVNPSTTDVLCTVTVEALAMGKQCVLARHPSNRFFEQFSDRCHFFEPNDTQGFIHALRTALAAGPPSPLLPEQYQTLTWDAACERLFDAAEVRVLSGPFQRPSEAAASRLAYQLHFDVMKDDTVLADVIRNTTFGEDTPWDEYFKEWRKSQMGLLRKQVLLLQKEVRPDHLQEHERYLKERIAEIRERFSFKG